MQIGKLLSWTPPNDHEKILSLTECREYVVIVTDEAVYRVEDTWDEKEFVVRRIGVI